MILDWVENNSLRKEEQLMNVLFDTGMATFRQLLVITGWTERQLRSRISFLYQLNKRDQEPDSLDKKWLQTAYASRQLREAVYSLGPRALKHVQQIREDSSKPSEAKLGQLVHYVKTTDILVRVLQSFEREEVKWFSSYEATDILLMRWNQVSSQQLNRRTSIRPDAKLYIQGNPYYIEFDNGTEGPRQVERKFHGYIEILSEIKDRSPIVWVTTTEKRKDYLQRNWEALKKISYTDVVIPEMKFFTEGEEISYLSNNLYRSRIG